MSTETNEREALRAAIGALEEIALASMSGSGQESEEGMRDWHARRAWEFIGIAARALEPARAALSTPPAAAPAISSVDAAYWLASRAGIIAALEQAGFNLMSNRDGFWLQKTPAAAPITMADAVAAGDGTLHGAIDHWQDRALAAEAKLAAQAAAVPTHPDVVSRYAEGWEDGMAEATKLMSEPDFQSSESETADHLAEAILSGMSYSELREKAIYLMALNANQARTIGALIAAAQGGASHADQG